MAPKIVVARHVTDGRGCRAGNAAGWIRAGERGAKHAGIPCRDGGSKFLIGYGGRSMDDAFYRASPNLKLIQLLSAGYDTCDIEAASRAGVPICNNGGANSIAVAERTRSR